MRLAFQPKASLIVVLPQWRNGYGLCSRWRLSGFQIAVQLCRAVMPFLCPFSFSLVMDIRSFLEFMLLSYLVVLAFDENTNIVKHRNAFQFEFTNSFYFIGSD